MMLQKIERGLVDSIVLFWLTREDKRGQ